MRNFLLKKGVMIPLIVVGSLLLLLVLINVLVPPIAKSYIEKHSKELCGRQVTVEQIKLNIFKGTLSLSGFQALEANDKDMFVSFEQLSVNMSLYRLFAKELRFTEITLVKPQISVWQKGSVFNFTDIIERFSGGDEEEEDTTKSGLAIDLRNITLDRGSVVYKDLERSSKFDLRDLSLAVPRLYFSGEKSDIGLHLHFAEGGSLAIKMLYGLDDNNYNLQVALKDFSVDMVYPYLKEFLNIEDIKGKLTANINAQGCLDHIMDIVAKGDLQLMGLKADMASQQKLLSLNKLAVDISEINLVKNRFYIDKVLLDGLDVNYESRKSSNTLSQLFSVNSSSTSTADEPQEETSESMPMDLKIKQFALLNSKVTYADYTLKQRFSLPVSKINIQADNLTLTEPFDLSLKAVVGSGGDLSGRWHGSLDDFGNERLNLNLRNVKLKDFSPYCVHYLSYPLTGGVLSFSTQDVIKNNIISSENKVDIYRCEVGKKMKQFKPEYNIPLRAAVYIITDRKGKIEIDLPVSGDISSPNFSFKKVIFKTLFNFLVKVVASPIDLIINAIGGSPDVFADMPYVISDPEISSENYARLDAMVEAMKSKPEMVLTIQPSVDKEESRQLLSQKLGITDSLAVEEALTRSMQHHEVLLQNYFVNHGIASSHVVMLPLGEKKTPKGKSLFSFDVKFPDDMLDADK